VKYIKLLWFDMRNGMIKKPMLFIIPTMVAFTACVDLTNRISSLNEFGYFDFKLTGGFSDYMMYIYGGMDKYVPDLGDPFVFPVRWTVVFLAVSFITLNYPYTDMQSFGQQILVRTKGRSVWWLSKCGWNILSSLVYHCLFFCVSFLFCISVQGSFSSEINKDLTYAVFQVSRESILSSDVPWPSVMLILPILISIGINLFQMVLSLFIKPIFSFFSVALLIISSSYLISPYLIGNYAMPVRYDMVVNDGVDIKVGLVAAIALIVISVVTGVIRFHKYDILNKD